MRRLRPFTLIVLALVALAVCVSHALSMRQDYEITIMQDAAPYYEAARKQKMQGAKK